jgi:hypothetical protein
MDISDFDFERDELIDLLGKLADLAVTVELEPRLHEAGERATVPEGEVLLHPERTELTYRIRCRLHRGDGTVRRLASLESEAGIETVFDGTGNVRIRHASAR